MSNRSDDLIARLMGSGAPPARRTEPAPTYPHHDFFLAGAAAADPVGLGVHLPMIGGRLTASAKPEADVDTPSDVACFAAGTHIATPDGDVAVEALREGDKVITRDNGVQKLRWIATRGLTGADLARAPHFRPICIAKDAFGAQNPSRDLILSPNHRVLVSSDRTALLFDDEEVLVAVKHLVGHRGVTQADLPWVTYYHLLFEAHEIVMSNGLWSESFRPSQRTVDGMGHAQRQEIYELFPDLKASDPSKALAPARRCLSPREARFAVI